MLTTAPWWPVERWTILKFMPFGKTETVRVTTILVSFKLTVSISLNGLLVLQAWQPTKMKLKLYPQESQGPHSQIFAQVEMIVTCSTRYPDEWVLLATECYCISVCFSFPWLGLLHKLAAFRGCKVHIPCVQVLWWEQCTWDWVDCRFKSWFWWQPSPCSP